MKKKISSFKNELILKLVPAVIIPVMVIGFFAYFIAWDALQTQALENSKTSVRLVNENLDSNIKNIAKLSGSVYYNAHIQEIVTKYSKNKSETFALPSDTMEMETYLRNLLLSNDYIHSAYAVTTGKVYFRQSLYTEADDRHWEDEPWYRNALMDDKPFMLLPTHDHQALYNESCVFTIVRGIKDFSDFKNVGLLVMNVNVELIDKVISLTLREGGDSDFYIYDSRNQWIYKPSTDNEAQSSQLMELARTGNLKETNQVMINDIKYAVSYHTSSYTGWTVVSLVNKKTLAGDLANIKWTTVLVTILSGAGIMLLLYFILNKITMPITHLRMLMKKVELGDLDVVYKGKGASEINSLGRSFESMIKRLKALIEENYEAQFLKQQAELSALQSQINPHFLYNTLESFQMIALVEGNERIARMSYSLGQLMRMILPAEEMVDLKTELEHVRHYLILMQERYEERLHYEIHVLPQYHDCIFPKFSLQPLVENAIYHGIDPQVEKGHIYLYGFQDRDDLVIEIVDNGVGMSKDQLDDIVRQLESESYTLDRKSQIGILNIHTRIHKLYGPPYGISIKSVQGKGTQLAIRIPFHRRHEEDEQ